MKTFSLLIREKVLTLRATVMPDRVLDRDTIQKASLLKSIFMQGYHGGEESSELEHAQLLENIYSARMGN